MDLLMLTVDTESDHSEAGDHSSVHTTWHQRQIAGFMVQLGCEGVTNQQQPCQTPHACTRAEAAVLIQVLGTDNERPRLPVDNEPVGKFPRPV